MTTQIFEKNEISLDGVKYKIRGPIQSFLASVYPAKVVIGDTTRDSQPRASSLAISDVRGGIGLNRSEETGTVNRVWWSTCALGIKNNLVLPRLATLTAAGPAATIAQLATFADEVYAAFGADVRKYDNSGDSWGSSLATLPASPTDHVVARLDGVTYLFFAHINGYTYTSDGSSFTDDTENMIYMAWWDDKIWGIDAAGQLRFSTFASGAPGDWADDAQLPCPDNCVTKLFRGEDSNGNSILYAMTTEGLFAHDFGTTRWVPTKLTLPLHPNNGKGTDRWRDSVYIPAGNGCYRYVDGTSTAVVTVMGPDRDDGLPSDKRGTIKKIIPAHNALFAMLDGTTAPGSLNLFAGRQSNVIASDTGFSSLLSWNDIGWEVAWVGGSSDKPIDDAIVSSAYSTYRLWWAQNQRVYWMEQPVDIVNPDQLTDMAYAAAATHETPWFNMGQDEVTKLAMHLDLLLSGIASTETVTLSYALNLTETYTTLKVFNVQSTDTHEHLDLPSAARPEGIPFLWIKFKLDFARGSTTTLTPKVHSLTLVYRKKLDPRDGFQFEIDMNDEYDGLSSAQQRTCLRAATRNEKKVEFLYRADDENSEEIRKFYVDVISATNLEQTGTDERGTSRVSLVQP